MAQLAVAWVLQNDNVAAAIVGASRPEQVAENVKAAGVHPRRAADPHRRGAGEAVTSDRALVAKSTPPQRLL